MIDGMVLGLAVLVTSAGTSPVEPSRHRAAPAAFTFELPQERGSTSRSSGRFRVDEQSRPVWRAAAFGPAQATSTKRFTKTDRVIAVAAGVAAGWFGGAAIGYYSTANYDNPNDDTSGLKGMIIGAPIGAAVGGILGYWLTNR